MRLGPPDSPGPDEPTMKLARVMHLEWCHDCADWRELGHTDQEKEHRAANAAQRQLEEEQFPAPG